LFGYTGISRKWLYYINARLEIKWAGFLAQTYLLACWEGRGIRPSRISSTTIEGKKLERILSHSEERSPTPENSLCLYSLDIRTSNVTSGRAFDHRTNFTGLQKNWTRYLSWIYPVVMLPSDQVRQYRTRIWMEIVPAVIRFVEIEGAQEINKWIPPPFHFHPWLITQ
jgi:hypothetical protein